MRAAVIPFKARAYLDLGARREAGERIDRADIRKHRNDMFRLMQLMPVGEVVPLPEAIAADMGAFIAAVDADETFDPKAIDLRNDPR